MITLLRVFGAVCALAVFLPLAGGFVVQQFHAPVTSRSLKASVEVEAGTAFHDRAGCRQRRSGVYRCDIGDEAGSGGYSWDVRVASDSSCWTAKLVADYGEGDPPKVLKGCVNHFERGWWGLIGF